MFSLYVCLLVCLLLCVKSTPALPYHRHQDTMQRECICFIHIHLIELTVQTHVQLLFCFFVLHSPWLQRFSQKHIPESQCRMTIERKKIQKNQNIENCVGIMVHLNHLLLYWRTGVQFLATMLCGNPTLLTSGGICTLMHITTRRHPHIHVIKIIIH